METHAYANESPMSNSSNLSQSSEMSPVGNPRAVAAAESKERLDSQRRKLTLIVVLFMVAGLVAGLSLTANGQGVKYEAIQMHPAFSDAAVMRKMETAAKDIAQRKDLSTVRDPNYAKAYYQTYLPGKLTQPDALADMSKLTQDVMKNLSGAQRSGNPGARQMIEWLYSGMKKVAEGNYQPAGRISALSILGRLDARPANTTAKTAPVPYAASFPVLLAQYEKETNPDGVRAAALQGLHRFVTIGFPSLNAQQRSQVASAMQKLLDSRPPQGRDRVAHAYLQRFAVDILASLEPDQGGKFGDTLVNVSLEPTRHDLIALYSVSKLANASSFGTAAENPKPVLDKWTVRAMRAFQYELERLELLDGIGQASNQPVRPEDTVGKQEDKTRFVPGYGGDESYEEEMDDGDYDEGGGMDSGDEEYYDDDDEFGGFLANANPQPPEVLASRKRLNFVLQQLHQGVSGTGKAGMPSKPGGMIAAIDASKQKQVEDWLEEMEALVLDLNDPLHDTRDKFKEALVEQIEMIVEIAGVAGEEAIAQDEKLPIGLNPYAKLAILSGESLENLSGIKPASEPVEPPVEEPTDVPEAAPQPPIGAAASNAVPVVSGS